MSFFNNFSEFIEKTFSKLKLEIIIFFIISLSFYYLLNVSWFRWGNLIIDTSRELWLPSQLLKGETLYKDLLYPFGFFPPYFLAFLYKIFGINISTLVGCGIAVTVLISLFIYKIARFFLDAASSGLVVLTFLFVFAFSYYEPYCGIYNFILPYSFASTFFMFFTTVSLFFFFKYIILKKEKFIYLWAAFLSLAFFCRPELSLPVWLAFVVTHILLWLKEGRDKFLRLLLYLFLPLIISLAGYALFFLYFNAFAAFKESFLGSLNIAVDLKLISRNSGLDNIYKSISLSFKSLFFHFLVIAILAVLNLFLIRRFTKKYQKLALGVGIIFLTIILSIKFKYLTSYFQYRCIPLVLLIGLISSACNIVRSKEIKNNLLLFSLFFVSLMSTLRISLNTIPVGYGFYLLTLGLISYYVFFIKLLPLFLKQLFKVDLIFLKNILICIFGVLFLLYWYASFSNYSIRNKLIDTGKGSIFCLDDDVTRAFWQSVDYLKENTLESDRIVVLPEGVSINYFSDRDNPLRRFHFCSLDPAGVAEAGLISDFIKFNINYIVIVHRNTFEFGHAFFGVDYGRKLANWIYANYKPIKLFGAMPFTSDNFGILILKRKN